MIMVYTEFFFFPPVLRVGYRVVLVLPCFIMVRITLSDMGVL